MFTLLSRFRRHVSARKTLLNIVIGMARMPDLDWRHFLVGKLVFLLTANIIQRVV